MPELPEVEVVRRGIDRWATRRPIAGIEVLHSRAARRESDHALEEIVGDSFLCSSRRGKYLWLPLANEPLALVVHLGMSGQVLMQPITAPDEKHLRVRVRFADSRRQMRFVDQRTFGGMFVDELSPDGLGGHLPSSIVHIARDPLDPHFDIRDAVRKIRSKRTEIKRALLDQTLVSGIGNIYADEALWRGGIHGQRITDRLSARLVTSLLEHATEVMQQALAVGGTSFDSLYVNVNGESGYFSRSLAVYGREGEPCLRCGRPIRREAFMNRSSFSCPACQRRPRLPGGGQVMRAT